MGAVTLSSLAGIPSGPVALLLSRVLSVCSTSSSLIINSVMCGSVLDSSDESGRLSVVNTDAK